MGQTDGQIKRRNCRTRKRIENFDLTDWDFQLAVGLKGAFICSKIFGTIMAENGYGIILNIASDLSVISPDQRLYELDGVTKENQPVKPVTYSVIKFMN